MIGAVVLMALLILLAPALFRGGETHPLIRGSSSSVQGNSGVRQRISDPSPRTITGVPSSLPVGKPPPVPEFVQVLDTAPEPVSVENRATGSEVKAESVGDSPGVDGDGQLKAWTLQVATFSDRSNADKLEKHLKGVGYSSYTRPVVREGGRSFYRVYLGPEVRTKELLDARERIKKEFGLEGVMTRFVP
ncbi:MAG: SPOR domain-containing protein [Endozoicomonas sp.]